MIQQGGRTLQNLTMLQQSVPKFGFMSCQESHVFLVCVFLVCLFVCLFLFVFFFFCFFFVCFFCFFLFCFVFFFFLFFLFFLLFFCFFLFFVITFILIINPFFSPGLVNIYLYLQLIYLVLGLHLTLIHPKFILGHDIRQSSNVICNHTQVIILSPTLQELQLLFLCSGPIALARIYVALLNDSDNQMFLSYSKF